MKINYKVFSKHAEKVAKKAPGSRPALRGIYHTEDGTITVTDSHRLYQAKKVNAPRNVLLDAVTGEEINQSYPDTSRLIPNLNDAVDILTTDTKKLLLGLKAMEQAIRMDDEYKKDTALVTLSENKIKLLTDEPINIEYEMDGRIANSNTVLRARLQYLLEAVDMLDDMKVSDVKILSYGSNRPMLVLPKNCNDILALIMLVRRY